MSNSYQSVREKNDRKYGTQTDKDSYDAVRRLNDLRYSTDYAIDTDYINQYLTDHSRYWSRYGAGEDPTDYRLAERRAAIDAWLSGSLADGTIDQDWYDEVAGILNDSDRYVGMYQGQRDFNSYLTDWEKWYNDSITAMDGMDWETGRTGSAALYAGMDGFSERDAAARKWLETYKDQLGPEYYSQMSNYLNRFGGYVEDLSGAYDQNAAYFNQWKSQNDYDRHNYLANLDTDSERWWVMSAEDAIKEMEDLEYDLNFSMGLYSAEDQERMKARYAGLQSLYGDNSKAAREAWKIRSAELDEAMEFQKGLRQSERIQGWQDKYAGMSYYDLNKAVGKVTDPEEKAWLEQYAPTVMTDADYGWEIGELNTQEYTLNKTVEELRQRQTELQQQITGYSRSSTVSPQQRQAAQDELNQVTQQLNEAQAQYEDLMRRKWQLEQDRRYEGLDENKDFSEISKTIAPGKTTAASWNGIHDSTYDWINNLGGYREEAMVKYGENDPYYNYWQMNQDEVDRYNYLYQTEGAEAAREYLAYLDPMLDMRWRETERRSFEQLAQESPILANALSVPMNLLGGAGFIDLSAQKMLQDITGEYRPINYYTPAMTPTYGSKAIRETTAGMITDATGTIQLDPEKHPVFARILNGRGLSDVYQLGMSVIDSRVAGLTGNPAAATALLASSAATSGVLDALERGATDEQALQMGMWNGAFEALFEFVEVNNLLKGDPNWIKAVTNQAITEGLGEGFTSIANNIADGIIMADKSVLQKKVAAYLEANPGMTEDEAYRMALTDMMIDVGWDIIGGAASGGLSAGGYSAVGSITSKMQYNALPKQIKTSTERLESLGLDRDAALDASGKLFELGKQYEGQRDAFMAAYDPKQNVYQYANDFKTAWEIGRNNGNQEQIGKLSLSESQGEIAYELGVAAAKAKIEAATVSPEEKESGYSVSEGGETVSTETGKKVAIKGFTSVGSDATLDIGGGKTIKAEDVSYADIDEAMLYETVAEVAGSTRNANNILEDYRKAAEGGMSASDYAAALRQTYDLGVSGQVAERQLGNYELAGKLGVGVRSIIFSQGRKRGDYKATAKQAVTQARGRQAKGNRQGTFHFERNGRTFSKTQEASLGALEGLSKALGVDIHIYESYEEGGKRVYQDRNGDVKSAPNGWYDTETGAIHIDLNAGNFGQGTMMFTAAHELTHFIKDWSPVKFRKLADLLIDRYAEQGVSVRDLIDNQIAKAEKNGRTIDRDTAFEEVVADSMETMLTQGDAASFMAELNQKDKTLREKVRDWFKNLAEKLRGVVDAYQGYTPDSPEGRLVAQMEDFIGVLQEAYSEALMDASENYRANEGKKNTTLEGGVKMQERNSPYDFSKPFAQQIDDWLKQDGTFPQNDTLLVGKTPKVLRDIGVPALPVTISQKNLKENLLGQYKGTSEEVADHAISPADMKSLPEKLANPVAIIADRRLVRNKWTVSESAIDVLIEMEVNGKESLVPVRITGNAVQQGTGIDANVVSSVHGNKDVVSRLRYALENDNDSENLVFYIDKDKTTAYIRKAGYPITSWPNISDGVNHSITDPGSPVKLRVTSQIETRQFKNWFGNSKIVNADGSPKVMYHGSQAQFDTFDRKKARSSGTYGKGFYFTNSTTHAGTYGNLYAVYLSIQNPVQYGKGSVSKDQVRKFLEAVADNEDYSIENYGTYDIDKILRGVMGGKSKADTFQVIQDINVTAIGDMVEAVKLFNDVNGTDYDGIVADTETVAFEPTQIKSATDNVGTFDKQNPNIYYSDRDPTAAATAQELEKQNAKLRQDVKDLRELLSLQGKLTKGTEFRKSSIEAAVKGLAQTAGATLDADGRTQLYDMLKGFYRYIASDENLAWDGVREEAGKIADFLQSNVKFKPQRSEYANDVLGYLRGQRVALSESQRAEVEKLYGYENFRRQLFGAGVYLSKDGISLDSLWHEAAGSDMFPGTFDMDVLEGDQPAELLRVIDGMREDDGSGALEYAYNRDFIRQDLIQAVYDSYWRVDNLHTVADRKQREINEIRRKHNERMDALTASHQETVKRLKEERRADIQAVREAYRERNARDLQKARERYAQARERGKESRAAASQRQIVEKAARDMMDMLRKPTKDAHVPMALQKPLEKLLDSIDFTSNRAAAGGEPTIRDVAYTRALQDVKLAIAAQRTALEGDGDGTFSLDVPKEFLDQIDAHIKMIQDATEGLDLTTNRVYEMSSDELRDLAYILKTINRAVRQIDKLHMEGAKARVSDLAKDTVWEMGRRTPVKTEDGGAAMWANYTPTFAFERMGSAATQILDGLKMGQAKLARTANAVIKFTGETYTNKEVTEWEKNVHEIKLESGKTVKMTTAQIMSFYCLSRREQAKGHLNGGGIRMGNIDTGRNEVIQREHYRLTQNDIAKINGMLTDRQMEVANKLQRYMADVGGKLGNEISMARWDYMEMTDKDYFPIRSDSDIHDARNPDQDKANLWGLLNKGFTKAVVKGANDAMIVSSVFDVFSQHMSEMAEYNAFALPLVDAMKWYNYRETQKGEGDHIKTVGVKKALNDTLGTAAGKYFIDLMTDINSSQKAGRFENFFGKLLSRSKAASVGWNLRVAIQQPTAILRASVYLDPKNLLKGITKFGSQKLGEEMLKHSGIALWKSLGYYDLNISRGITDQIKGDTTLLDKMNDWGMWLPGKMDQWTWTSIWAGCKAQVQAEKKLTGEALLEETAKQFENLVYHTQVADSVLTRSSIMRSKSQTIKELTSFMAEPTMSANLLLSAFQDYREGVTKEEKAKRTMRIAFCGYVLSGLANALVTAFADAARDDDEYEGFWEKYFQALLGEKVIDGNLFAELNPLEKIVFVRDILSIIQGYEGSKNPFMELVESCIGLFENVGKFMQGKGSLTAYGLIYQGLQVLGSFTGAAPANMLREVTTIWNNTFGKWNNMIIHRYKTNPKEDIKNAYQSGALGKREAQNALIEQGVAVTDAYWMVKEWDTGNTSKYTDLYTAALNGQDISDFVKELTENGKTEKEVLGELKSQIGTWYTDPESDNKITREQAQSMLQEYLGMEPDKAEALLREWDMRKDVGFSPDSLKSKFMEEAVTEEEARDYLVRYSGLDADDAEERVAEWAFELEHGYSYDDIRQTYQDGEITADEARDVMMEVAGKTREQADYSLLLWDFEKENGWKYEDRASLYKDGKITRDQLSKALMDVGEYEKQDALYQVEVYDWEMEGLEGATIKRVQKWHEYCKGAGISKETFLDIQVFSANTKNDVDSEGKTINYSAMKKVMAEINRLPLSDAQKDALAQSLGWSEKNIRKYKPW